MTTEEEIEELKTRLSACKIHGYILIPLKTTKEQNALFVPDNDHPSGAKSVFKKLVPSARRF